MSSSKGLMERLKDKETIVCAEGYVFNFERRGYLKAGPYVPEVVLEHPHLVRQLYEEFVHAGSDVVLAFTYYAHREKMCLVGREEDIEKINRDALKMAREVANETGTLMAGNICNTNIFHPDDPTCSERIKAMFKEQIEWAVEEGADFIVAETFFDCAEVLLAVKAVKEYGKGELLFPLDLDCRLCQRKEIFRFGKKCKELGIQYVGICCGNSAHYTRSLCNGLGKSTPASTYAPDMSLHCLLGTSDKLCKWQTDKAKDYFIGTQD